MAMKQPAFEFAFHNIGQSDIYIFEEKYKIHLPEDYKNFLLSTNGGKTVNRKFNTNDPTKKGKINSSIVMFFPLSNQNDMNLEDKYREFTLEAVVPSRFLPIGNDPVGNLICLSMNGNDKNSVYHCDLDYLDEDKELKDDCIRLISSGFKEFIESLASQ